MAGRASSSPAMQDAVAIGEPKCGSGESFFPFLALFFSSGTTKSFWKERNDRIFRKSPSMPEDIVLLVDVRVAEWALLRKEFIGMNLECILQNWEACMSCGPSKDKKAACWRPPPSGG
ncbi:hypothetical protein AAC387_Pa07g1436 [Persea americana]